jgi:very-short-patch-repair endonuclease
MKYPGQPESPPSWYKDRGQSYIEKEFSRELNDLADAIESEHWFGDSEKHSRFRVDFILKDARLIIELDGYDYHSTKEQLEKDAIRQRYLSRAGYTVIRFTGGEINRNPKDCVLEVRQIYNERIQRSPAKYRVMYIDYPFVRREAAKAIIFFKQLHPNKNLAAVNLEELIPHAIEWLHEKSFITAFVFHPEEDSHAVKHLDGYIKEYEKGEVRINIIAEEWYSLELGNHMVAFSHLFDQFFLVSDDAVYCEPLRTVLPKEFSPRKIGSYESKYLANGKLLRKGNEETAYRGTDLAYVLWQDIWYIIGASVGLQLHEM